MLRVLETGPERRAEVADFYRTEWPDKTPDPSDRVFIAEVDGRLVGAVRRCEEAGFCVLRSMRVTTELQRRGIGRRLLQEFARALGERDCYLLGYSHLEGFYGSVGFARIPMTEVPPHLRQRLQRYLDERPDVIPMRRAASASPAT